MERRSSTLLLYILILFLTSLILGLGEILLGAIKASLGYEILTVPGDIFGGFILLVISATFLRGLTYNESRPFLYVGCLILGVFGVLHALVLLAGALDALIIGEDPLIELRPEILLSLLAIPGLIEFNRERKRLPP